MRKAKFLFIAAIAFGAFTLGSCGGTSVDKAGDTEKTNAQDSVDKKSKFYDKDAVGEVVFNSELIEA